MKKLCDNTPLWEDEGGFLLVSRWQFSKWRRTTPNNRRRRRRSCERIPFPRKKKREKKTTFSARRSYIIIR